MYVTLHLRRQSRHVEQGSSFTLCTYIITAIYKYRVYV